MNTSTRMMTLALGSLTLGLAACTTMPTGPSVLVLPGSTKTFEQFRIDDAECRQFAHLSVGGRTAEQAQTDSALKSAAVGAALGAGAGALINGSSGAGVGAGAGLIMGGLAGSGAANESSYGLQRRYDYGYQQCMYAKGNRIPTYGRYAPATTPPPAAVARPAIENPASGTASVASQPPPPPPPPGPAPAPPPPGSAPAQASSTSTVRPAPPPGLAPSPPPDVMR